MDKHITQDPKESLYNTNLKNIETNLEKFIQKKEELLFQKRTSHED